MRNRNLTLSSSHRSWRLASLALAALLVLAPAVQAQQSYVPIEQRLSAEQMQASGIDTLSRQQLQVLNSLLSNEQAAVEERVERTTRSRLAGLLERQKAEPIRSAVKGEFRGWVPGNVIELETGQRWLVTEGTLYLGQPMAAPMATVTPGMFSGWYLQVDGQSPRAKVQPLP